ncbi:hypothetical protein P8631_09185 [Guyparkeria sp. 1SP6A2]|nr:hypothetical protein [Guyparkeria sp. 1SP6A2]
MRKLSLVIAGILGAGGPLISQAATLGEARVESNLTEPLQVVVPLARTANESLDELSVQLAPASFYREAGVPLESLSGNLTFAIKSDRNGDYVLIGSKRPIRDPILSVLLQVSSPEGRMIREFNLLLDPPSTGSTSRSPTETTPSGTSTRQTTAAASASTWQRPASVPDVDLTGTYKVQSGDTLYEIAREHVGEGEDVRPMMQAIIDANPQAFRNGNGNAMMAGADLQVPARAGQGEAADVSQQSGKVDSGLPGNRLPALELLSPEENKTTEPAPANVGGFGNLSASNRLPAIAGSPSETSAGVGDGQGALDREEMESIRAENEALTDQLRALKDQIDSVQVSISDRDARIAELQAAVDESRSQARELESLRGNFWLDWGKYLTGILGLIIIALLIALGLKGRSRERDEPAVPMPATAASGSSQPAQRAEAASEPREDSESRGGQVAGAALAGAAAPEVTQSQPEETERGGFNDDPMNPEMALEESQVLESFNLTHQALELLQDSLAEHPGHPGLQEAINRLNDRERGAEAPVADQPDTPDNQSASQDDAVVDQEPADNGELRDEAPQGFESASPDRAAEPSASAGGSIDWDNDLDDMLATPEPEPNREGSGTDESLMEFDDSYALETPTADKEVEGTDTREAESATTEAHGEDDALELPGFDLEAMEEPREEPREEAPGVAHEKATDDELSLSAPEFEPLEADETASPEASQEPAEEPVETDSSATDTRVGLAEAFLDVGDEESFEMIKSELQEEGATEALGRLEELKQRRAGG